MAASAVSAVGGLAVAALMVVNLPATYLCDPRPRAFWAGRHPLVRWTGLLLKNALGVIAVVLGLVLSMPGVPGPGLLTMLLGLTLLDFPGKGRFKRWLVSRPNAVGILNRLRRRYRKPPLQLCSKVVLTDSDVSWPAFPGHAIPVGRPTSDEDATPSRRFTDGGSAER